ncbi:MAG: sodium:proton exchanger [Nitrospirae bacterium]|nr:MAG: sodium:proton exchanger [Nitrospirota bacterium]
MIELTFLRDLVILFGASIVVVYCFNKLRVPAVVGFLVAGTLLGPYGLDVVNDVSHVEILAEVGVVMLLFTIGVEVSLARITSLRTVVGGGLLQIGAAIALSALAGLAFGLPVNQGVFWGFLTAMSSTAIVLKMLTERGETNSPQGRLTIGVLIVQDLSVVPMMVLTPVLAGQGEGGVAAVAWSLLKALLLVTLILVAARFLIPRLLIEVVRSRSRELFTITIILACLGIAWLSSLAGLSLALGAFIAGLIISESEYSHQAMAEILPFRDSFNSLFFISIGMLLDLRVLLSHPVLILGLVALVVAGKFITAAGAAVAAGYPWRPAVLTGVALAQVGEFSFILSKVGKEVGLLTAQSFQVFLTVSVLTLLLTPFLIQASPRVARRAEAIQRLRHWLPERPADPQAVPPRHLRDHTIIAGYGVNGRNLAQVLRETEIAFVVVEMDGEAVRQEQQKDMPIYFGDVTHPQVLRRLGIHEARALVLAISDPIATRRAVKVARQLNPALHIIARTRYLREIDDLRKTGADQVVPEEFETSIEIFSRVLQHYRMPSRVIAEKAERIRKEGYALLRKGQPDLREIVAREVEDLYVDD